MTTHLKAKTGKILFKDYLSFVLFLFSVVSTVRVIEQGEVTPGVLAEKRFSRGGMDSLARLQGG